MSIGMALVIFRNIENTIYTDEEKIEAIKILSERESINVIEKVKIVEAMKWLLRKVMEDMKEES